MICRHFGRYYSSETLNRFLRPSTEGVSVKGMANLCEIIGIDTITGKISIDDLAESPLPCVLHWNQNHFVVLYSISGKKTQTKDKRKYHVADPAKGKIQYSTSEMIYHWASNTDSNIDKPTGIAMFFEPLPSFKERQIDNESPRRSFKLLFDYFKAYKKQFASIALALLIGSALQLVLPFLMQWIVDIGIKNEDIRFIWLILLGELLIVIGRAGADFIRRWILLKISTKINISLVSDFFIKLLKLPMSFFDTKLMGDLLQRMGDHDRVQTFLTGELLGLVFTIITFIVLGAMLCVYDIFIFAVFLTCSTIYGMWIASFLSKRKVLDYEVFEKQAINNNLTYRFISSIQEIKLQSCEQRRRLEWEDTQSNLLNTRLKRLKLQQTQEAGSIFIGEIRNILITVLTATAVINHDMTLGGMLAVQYIIGQLSSPVSQMMGFIYSIQDVKISMERINEIHDSKNEQQASGAIRQFPSDNRDIELKKVDFKYDIHRSSKTLDDINVLIKGGETTAIVGTSGSGKTTIIKLLLGYYHPLNGKIEIGGHNLNNYNMKWWRGMCGVVMQDGVIFSESIARNIAVSDGKVDVCRIREAAKIACADKFIEALPLKYETKIGPDGMGLSIGQRQRILIARAVYKNPDYIFFDEATNSLDANNEKEIVDNLTAFFKGKTVVIVAHRLSTVKNADKIIVIDEGNIVESGTHDSLISAKGYYFNLVRNQIDIGN